MNPTPRRRWFRYSLRMAFVAVTILCICLAWQLSIVRPRVSLLRELRANSHYTVETSEQYALRWPGGLSLVGMPAPVEIPRVRRWLGDEAIQQVNYWPGVAPEELSRIARMFPEAQISEVPLEPCHPGCFPAGTPIETPGGLKNVETLRPGDVVTIVESIAEATAKSIGKKSQAHVQSVFVTDNQLLEIVTQAGSLLTTSTQPLCPAFDRTVPAGEIRAGDEILHCAGGEFHFVKVVSVAPTTRLDKVYNVVLGNSQIFIAGGYLARSKPPAGTPHVEFVGHSVSTEP
jgi:hypothetical protein